jgi:hypothetical protein
MLIQIDTCKWYNHNTCAYTDMFLLKCKQNSFEFKHMKNMRITTPPDYGLWRGCEARCNKLSLECWFLEVTKGES